MLEDFKNYMIEKKLSENTYKSYLKNIENQKPSTINRKLNALKKFNEYLVANNIQCDIVIDKRDYIKIAPNFVKKDVPEEKEINKLIYKAGESKRDTCIMILASNGGLRAEEIVTINYIISK